MKDEIKEILDEMKFMQERKVKFYSLDIYQSKILLDYITNLQEQLETYKDTETYSKNFLYKENKERLKANQRLREENERLNNEIKEKYIEWQVFDDVIGEISEILITKNVNFTKLELLKRRLLDKFYRY